MIREIRDNKGSIEYNFRRSFQMVRNNYFFFYKFIKSRYFAQNSVLFGIFKAKNRNFFCRFCMVLKPTNWFTNKSPGCFRYGHPKYINWSFTCDYRLFFLSLPYFLSFSNLVWLLSSLDIFNATSSFSSFPLSLISIISRLSFTWFIVVHEKGFCLCWRNTNLPLTLSIFNGISQFSV